MTQEEWAETYEPMPHPAGEDHGYEIDGRCCMIEPSEKAIISRIPQKHLWTIIEDETGGQVIVAGFQTVNRIGYLQTRVPWDTGDEMTEPDSDYEDDELDTEEDDSDDDDFDDWDDEEESDDDED